MSTQTVRSRARVCASSQALLGGGPAVDNAALADWRAACEYDGELHEGHEVCNATKWNGTEWNGMEWIGMDRNGSEWIGMEWNGMEWNGMEWNGME